MASALAVAEASTSAHDTISNPGNVQINVEGAFIVDEEASASPKVDAEDEVQHDSNDIRLPKHTTVISHVAVDVSAPGLTTWIPRRWFSDRSSP